MHWTARSGANSLGAPYRLKGGRARLLVVVLAIAIAAGLGSSHLSMAIRSAYLAHGLLGLEKQPEYLQRFAHPVEYARDQVVLENGTAIDVDVYRPPSQGGPWPALLLIPGFDRLGLEDPYVVGLARLLSGAGVVVVVPGLNDLFEYRWSAEIGGQIEGAFEYMAKLPAVRADRLGLFGLSISGGLGLGAATRPSIAARLSYSIVLAPFHDYAQVFRFMANACQDGDGAECSRQPNAFARRIFFYNYLHLLLPGTDQDYSAIREILRLRLHQKMDEAGVLAGRLSTAGQGLLERLEKDTGTAFETVAELAIADFKNIGDTISPHANLCRLQGKLFIIHGRDDGVIPYSESLAMAKHCDQCSNLECDLLGTDLYGHVDFRFASLSNLSDYPRFFAFVYRITNTVMGN